MTQKDLLEKLNIKDIYQLPSALMEIVFSPERNDFYSWLLEKNEYDVSYDWFQSIYETEMSQRKDKKQDFTPGTVSEILSKLTGFLPSVIHEPTAGNGGLLIKNWWHRCLNSPYPILHNPSDHPFVCWELSSRSIPILLLNLSIRGMTGMVYHGDVLENKIESAYFLHNEEDDTLGFSTILKFEHENK